MQGINERSHKDLRSHPSLKGATAPHRALEQTPCFSTKGKPPAHEAPPPQPLGAARFGTTDSARRALRRPSDSERSRAIPNGPEGGGEGRAPRYRPVRALWGATQTGLGTAPEALQVALYLEAQQAGKRQAAAGVPCPRQRPSPKAILRAQHPISGGTRRAHH